MTTPIVLLVASLLVFFTGLLTLWQGYVDQARLEEAVRPPRLGDGSLLTKTSKLDSLARRFATGRRLDDVLIAAHVPMGPGRFIVLVTLGSLAIGLFLGNSLSWLLFPLGMAIGVFAARMWIKRQRDQRREAFIAQMPELARTLSNASSAGLSIRTAIAIAAEELDEPSRSELNEVSAQLSLGRSLDDALTALERRLPSREVSILVSSLVVSARSGGALVGALRDIADTLETRKELRREVRTTYAQTLATAWAILGMGALSLFMLEKVNEGTIDAMLRSPLGQLALIVAVGAYSLGIWVVRRMTRANI